MKNLLKEFKEFALRGSVIDLAIGIIVGAGFNTVVNSLVKNIVLPPIGLILNRVDFSNMYVSLSGGHYTNLAEAQKAGAVTLNYGLFLNDLISFIITAFVVFFVIRWINKMQRRRAAKEEKASPTRHCPFCDTAISVKATRCPQCTSTLSEAVV
jgi:large conductance mechanosensitive channel